MDEQAQPGEEIFRPFPKRRYFEPILDVFAHEEVTFVKKSRTMMLTWLACGYCAFIGFNRPGSKIVFQSEDELKAIHCVRCVKVLWEQSLPSLRARWPLSKPLIEHPRIQLEMANGTIFLALPQRADKIRYEHPTIVMLDEAAHIECGEDSFHVALATRCPKMICVSSAREGWFEDIYQQTRVAPWPSYNGNRKAAMIPGLEMRRTKADEPFIFLHYTADETFTPQTVDRLRLKFKSKAHWDREMEGKADAMEGTPVFPEFSTDLHVIPDDSVPRTGTIYMAIDPHPRTPHAFLWVLVDRWNDYYVYREIWPSVIYGVRQRLRDNEEDNHISIRSYAEIVAHMEGNELEWHHAQTDQEYAVYKRGHGGERIYQRYMDQAGKGFRASGEAELMETYARRYTKYGIEFSDPKKSVETGYDVIRTLLKPRTVDEAFAEHRGLKGREWPRLHIAESCIELRLEMRSLRYQQRPRQILDREQKQDPTEYRRHLVDLLRYIAVTGDGYVGSMASNRYEMA